MSHLSHESKRVGFHHWALLGALEGGCLGEEIYRVQKRENAILVGDGILTAPLLEETSPDRPKHAYLGMVQSLSSPAIPTQVVAIAHSD